MYHLTPPSGDTSYEHAGCSSQQHPPGMQVTVKTVLMYATAYIGSEETDEDVETIETEAVTMEELIFDQVDIV